MQRRRKASAVMLTSDLKGPFAAMPMTLVQAASSLRGQAAVEVMAWAQACLQHQLRHLDHQHQPSQLRSQSVATFSLVVAVVVAIVEMLSLLRKRRF